MTDKIKRFLAVSAYSIYGVLFAFILWTITFNNFSFDYNIPAILLFASVFIVVIAVALTVYTRFSDFFIKNRYKILAAVCIILFAIQLCISMHMIPAALYDYEKVLNGAMIWAKSGDVAAFDIYRQYLQHYPHQMGTFLLQQTFFKISLAVGYDNLFIVACLVGHIMFTAMIVSSFIYLDENVNSHRALFFLLITFMFFPLYFQSSIAYTDTYSVWGIPCLLLFISRGFKAESQKKRMVYGLLSGLTLALSMQLKSTAAIVVIAMAIQYFVKGFKKHHLPFTAIILICAFIASSAFDRWAYSDVLDRNNSGDGMPLTHWLMMGLQGDGSYSAYDEWRITCSVEPEKRVARNIEVIKQRLEEMGPIGYMNLLYLKTCRTFGSGDAELYVSYQYVADATPINLVYEITLNSGRFFPIFRLGSQAMYLLYILLGVVGSIFIILKKDKNLFNFAPHIALIGFWIFMMLWESNHRQLINQWSLFFITAAVGVYYIWQFTVDKLKNK